MGSVPGLRRSSGEGHGNPLLYSFLENPVDRGAWWATILEVTKIHTWLIWQDTPQVKYTHIKPKIAKKSKTERMSQFQKDVGFTCLLMKLFWKVVSFQTIKKFSFGRSSKKIILPIYIYEKSVTSISAYDKKC